MQNNSMELKNIQLELKSQINQNNEFLDLIQELEQEKVRLLNMLKASGQNHLRQPSMNDEFLMEKYD